MIVKCTCRRVNFGKDPAGWLRLTGSASYRQLLAKCRLFCCGNALNPREDKWGGGEEQKSMPRELVDFILRKEEKAAAVLQGAVKAVEANRLAANSPCEDHHSVARCSGTESWLAGVFDGHGGGGCSQALSRRLLDYCCASLLPSDARQTHPCGETDSLEWLWTTSEVQLEGPLAEMHRKGIQRLWEAIRNQKRATLAAELQLAFTGLDTDFEREALPEANGRLHSARVATVASGSCACVAHVRGPHLHLINTGDSGAVLGVCGEDGASWSARQLTKEHCIENPEEEKRIRSEHPLIESSSVLLGGRLLGELFPLRAFGDFRYKWPEDLLRVVMEPFYGSGVVPPNLHTPPYLTAEPEVFYHRLTPSDRFLVIGSDGLWEQLSPERVVRLVADHSEGKQTLSPYSQLTAHSVAQTLADLRVRKRGEDKRPLDINGATNLIRHALGGHKLQFQYSKLSETLSLTPDVARQHRDDITIIIIHFDQKYLASVAD